jgi:hypothetical protein
MALRLTQEAPGVGGKVSHHVYRDDFYIYCHDDSVFWLFYNPYYHDDPSPDDGDDGVHRRLAAVSG